MNYYTVYPVYQNRAGPSSKDRVQGVGPVSGDRSSTEQPSRSLSLVLVDEAPFPCTRCPSHLLVHSTSLFVCSDTQGLIKGVFNLLYPLCCLYNGIV